jgi:MFS family permease
MGRRAGSAAAGPGGNAGRAIRGQDTAGPDRSGPDRPGPGAADPGTGGSGAGGPASGGPGTGGPGRGGKEPGLGTARWPAARLRRARLAALAFFAVLGLSNGVWVARIPAVKQQIGLSDGLLGLTLLAAPVGLVLVVLLAGRVVDRFGSRVPTLTAGCCVALLPVTLGLAPTMPLLMVALFAFGVAGGTLDVAMNAQAVHIERGYRRPLMSSFHACYSFAGLAGALFGGLFAWAGLGPAVNFLAAGVPLAVLAAWFGHWLLPGRAGSHDDVVLAAAVGAGPAHASEIVAETAQADSAFAGQVLAGTVHADAVRADTLRAGVHSAAPGPAAGPAGEPEAARRVAGWTLPVLILGLLSLCSLLAEGSADSWSAVYLHDSLGTSAGLATLGYAAFSLTMACGRLGGDRLAARFGPVALVRCCGLLAAAGLAGALISASPAGAIAGFAVFGAGLSCTFPQLLSAAGNADRRFPGSAIARVAGLGYVGILGGPVIIGGIAAWGGLPLALGVPVLLAACIAAGAGQVRPRPAS